MESEGLSALVDNKLEIEAPFIPTLQVEETSKTLKWVRAKMKLTAVSVGS